MGPASLLMVIGFNLIFALVGFSLSRVTTDAYRNYVDYYNFSVARHIASSAANIASTQITFNPNWRIAYSNVSFGGGKFSTTVTNLDSSRIQVNVSAFPPNGVMMTDNANLHVKGVSTAGSRSRLPEAQASPRGMSGSIPPLHTRMIRERIPARPTWLALCATTMSS